MLTYIRTDKLLPHPNNPRKNLGDLTELAASIKANGILQNLTVVPVDAALYQKKTGGKKAYPGNYTVVIGHRRHAAAQLAGLFEVPCSITDMDEKTQLSTMLLENMQRSDLTIYEQAQGFQMMLDLGVSVNDISQETGFSRSTVYSRVKLLELDGDKFRESVERGASLGDYAKLDKLTDPALKNSVLDQIGTTNFEYALKSALDAERWAQEKAAIIDALQAFATQAESTDGYSRVKWYSKWDKNAAAEMEKPTDAGEGQYFFFDAGDSVYLLKEVAGEPEPVSEAQLERQRVVKVHGKLDEVSRRAYALRQEFVRKFTAGKKHTAAIMEFAVRSMISGGWAEFDESLFQDMLGIELDEEELSFDDISQQFTVSPERVLLLAAYCNEADSERWTYYDWNCIHEANEDLDAIYTALEKLGYPVSDEEQALRDGTHELLEG